MAATVRPLLERDTTRYVVPIDRRDFEGDLNVETCWKVQPSLLTWCKRVVYLDRCFHGGIQCSGPLRLTTSSRAIARDAQRSRIVV